MIFVFFVRHRIWVVETGFFLTSKQYSFYFLISSFVDRLKHWCIAIPTARAFPNWIAGNTCITIYLFTLIALLSWQFRNIKTDWAPAWIDELFILSFHYLICIKVIVLYFVIEEVKLNFFPQSILAKLISLVSYLLWHFLASLIQIKMLLLQVSQRQDVLLNSRYQALFAVCQLSNVNLTIIGILSRQILDIQRSQGRNVIVQLFLNLKSFLLNFNKRLFVLKIFLLEKFEIVLKRRACRQCFFI
jgi:hypothetical protein